VKQQHTSAATSILTIKSTYRSQSAQRLSERTVLWISLVQRFVWIAHFAGIAHNAYETGLESGTNKHVSIKLFGMKSSPKIFANFKDGNIAFYFNNINCEISGLQN
jgi:hypothetical protein